MKVWKWPKSGLRLINLYVNHATAVAAKLVEIKQCFSLFTYFRDFFLDSDLAQLKVLSCAHLLALRRKNVLPRVTQGRVFWKKYCHFSLKSWLQTLLFHLFRTSETCYSILTRAKKNSLAYLLVVPGKKFISCGTSMIFLRRKICVILKLKSIFKNLVFDFFVIQRFLFQFWIWPT